MNISNSELRNAKSEDLDAIKRLLESHQLPYEDITQEKLEHYFLMDSEDQIFGVIGLEKYNRFGLLRSLAVSSDYQNNGLGGSLVTELEDYARNLNIDELYLLTTTAAQFFRRAGYNEIAREEAPEEIRDTEEFSDICPASATTVMKKEI